jgi:hypothetical protein
VRLWVQDTIAGTAILAGDSSMKRWHPADPAAFRPLPFQRSPSRALVVKPALALPGPARAAVAAFVFTLVVIL